MRLGEITEIQVCNYLLSVKVIANSLSINLDISLMEGLRAMVVCFCFKIKAIKQLGKKSLTYLLKIKVHLTYISKTKWNLHDIHPF